jgi:lipopolysaccharide export LptBFGC system permease protein LptF
MTETVPSTTSSSLKPPTRKGSIKRLNLNFILMRRNKKKEREMISTMMKRKKKSRRHSMIIARESSKHLTDTTHKISRT